MGREVRMVKPDWEHPKDENTGRYKPLHCGNFYQSCHDDWLATLKEKGLQETIEWNGNPPDINDYMPNWTKEEATYYMMYEDTSEGTPISPAFATPQELAQWLVDNKASSFADMTATYEQWLRVCCGGYAPSMVLDASGLRSGVAV